MELKIQYVRDVLPISYMREGDAAFDLRAALWVVDLDNSKKELDTVEYLLKPNERILVKTGIKIAIPSGFWGNIRDRSGLAYKHGIHTLAGVIDETYRGEIGVILINTGTHSVKLTKNERIAQMIITPVLRPDIISVDSLDSSVRDESGFGSSGRV